MTRKQAAVGFFVVTGVFVVVFVAMTLHSHTRFPELTHADGLTEDVLAGKDVWHHGNCVNCHTLMGEGAYYAPDLTEITQHRGSAYLTQFMKDPGQFYSEEEDGRLMTNPNLSEDEIRQVIAFMDWIAGIDNFDWPPRPILVRGGAVPQAFGPDARQPASDDPVELGEVVFRATPPGCFTCHSTAPGVTLVGPSMAGVADRAEAVLRSEDYAGTATTAEAFVRESILEPSVYIPEGPGTFAAGGRSIMPENYGDTLTDDQVAQLVAYLTSLR